MPGIVNADKAFSLQLETHISVQVGSETFESLSSSEKINAQYQVQIQLQNPNKEKKVSIPVKLPERSYQDCLVQILKACEAPIVAQLQANSY